MSKIPEHVKEWADSWRDSHKADTTDDAIIFLLDEYAKGEQALGAITGAHDNLVIKARLLLEATRGPGIVLTPKAIEAAKNLEQLAYAKAIVVHEPLPDWVLEEFRNATRKGQGLSLGATETVAELLRERGLL